MFLISLIIILYKLLYIILNINIYLIKNQLVFINLF